MIERVEIENYKCIRKVTVDLGMFNVLIGPNDSGKSAFLQAMSMTWGSGSGLNAHTIVRRVAAGATTTFTTQQVIVTGAGVTPIDAQRWELLHPLRLEPDAVLTATAANARSIQDIARAKGRGTTAQLAHIALAERTNYEAIQASLASLTNGRVREFVIQDSGGGLYTLHYRLFDNTVVDGRAVSQGVVLLTAFLALVHRDDAPKTLLIEEPENGIHPRRVFEVLSLLRKLSERGVQIVLTTHSPDLLSACKPEEVLVFRRPNHDSSTEIHRLPPTIERRLTRETLGELWAAVGEEGLLDLPREIPVAGVSEIHPKGA